MRDFSRRLGRPDLTRLGTEDLNALLDGPDEEPEPIEYMNKAQIARYLKLKDHRSMSHIDLPPPDAILGNREGWLKSTVDAWKKTRPGRGRWGAR